MDLALNLDTGDLDMPFGDVYLLKGSEAVGQFCAQRLRTGLSEWFLDEQRGFPYFDLIFKKSPDYVAVDAALKDYVLQSPGIVELLTWDLNFSGPTRVLSLAFSARSRDGTIYFEEKLGA